MTESGITDALRNECLTAEKIEKERATHKPASRVYFDLLTEFFPPRDTPEYWERLLDRIVEVCHGPAASPLLSRLVQCLFLYLEDLVKENDKARIIEIE